MATRRAVVVLGGNAFVLPGQRLTMAGQFEFARQALSHLRPLLKEGCELLLSHGNGPQVGHMLIRVEQALGEAYALPLEVCVAESEGELGYVLEQSLYNVLAGEGCQRPIASLLTQVVVDPADPAFLAPSKPIGPAYDEVRGRALEQQGFVVVHEPGRGFRRVVPSPRPLEIVELEVLQQLLARGVVVIAGGGGGIPVIREGSRLRGVDAVIDKDRTGALLARQLDAELFIILTGVPSVFVDFGTERARAVGVIHPDELEALAREGHFPEGNMGPKVEAAIDFARRTGRDAIVCDPPGLEAALQGRGGTMISTRQGAR